jgi:hypothetical protein
VARQSCEISLRDLADALQTSSRMLGHHFGSRDAVIAADPVNRPFFRLFDEVNALAQTHPDRFPGFGRASVYDWLPQFTELLGPSTTDDVDAQAQATLALAVIRGLMLDENATGEPSRIDAAALTHLSCVRSRPETKRPAHIHLDPCRCLSLASPAAAMPRVCQVHHLASRLHPPNGVKRSRVRMCQQACHWDGALP